jgi:hypothetical protein
MDHNQRWGYDGEKYNYTATLLNDYENVLSALVALKIKEQEEYISDFIGKCLFSSIVDEKCPLKSGHGKQTV